MGITKRTRKNGKVAYQVRLRGPDRKLHNKTFSTRKAADAYERDLKRAKETGTWVDPSKGRQVFGPLLEDYITERPAPLAERTERLYRDLYRLLRAVLNVAVADELIVRNPCMVKNGGREKAPERPLISPEQVLAISKAIAPRLEALVLLAGFGGLRRGELLGLQRRDFNHGDATVRIERQVADPYLNPGQYSAPKTEAGTRTVYLPSFVAEVVAVHLDEHTDTEPTAPMFVGVKGGALRVVTLYDELSRTLEDLGIEGFGCMTYDMQRAPSRHRKARRQRN